MSKQNQYQEWPLPFQNMDNFIDPPQDELLVYQWEGFGRPYSTSGSLSSLESFGHVDDLDLSKLQLLEAAKSNLSDTNSTTLTSNSEVDDSSSTDADYEISQKQHHSFTDSWV